MILNLRKTTLLALLLAVQSTLIAQTGIPRIVINSMGHSAKVNNLMFTPDGTQIISVSEDKTVRVWSTATGEMKSKFESQIGDGYEGAFYASDLSPDGKLLAISGYPVSTEKENYIVIIDITKGAQVATAVGGSPDVINALGFINDGKYLVGGGDDGKIKVWSVSSASTLSLVATIAVGAPVKYFAINPVTKDVAVAAEGKTEILLYSLGGVDKGAVKSTPRVLKRHRGEINKLAYSADGTYLASSSYETTEFFLWKADGTFVKDFPVSTDINAIAFSSDAKILVGLDVKGKGASYSIPQGSKFADFTGHDNTVFSAVISPSEQSGNYMVASAGGSNNEIYLWNPINGRTIKKIKGKGSVIGDLTFGNGFELYISRVLEGKPDFKTSFDFLNFNVNRNPAKLPPPKVVKSSITQTSPFDLDLGRGKLIQNDPTGDGRILTYKTLPDGNIVVGSDYSLRMYDKDGLLLKEFIGHSGGVRGISLTADGAYLASGGEDQTIILWKLSETGAARSLRQEFPEETWANFFSSLPVDSLTKEPTKKAWRDVIDFLKANGDKTYKGIEEVYKNLGEAVLPFATLFLTEDFEWVCWTPKGYFTCTSSGSQYFGWHVNRGINKLADFYAAEQYFEILYKPKQMQRSVAQGKRIEEILIAEGERLFDLSRLHTPSAGFIEVRNLINNNDVQYQEGKLSTSKTSLTLDVEVFDGGGGVREVNLYQNDKLILTDKEFKTRQGDRVEKQYKVDLLNETNEFKVIVKNYQKMESKPFSLKIDYVGQVMATSSLHVMVVGINNYKNGAYNLNYAQPDASSFINQLSTNYEKIFKTVNKVEIYNEDATKENIIKGFNSVIAKARPEDVFVFFYAGHGSLDEDHKDSDGESPFYFVPTDVTKIYGDPEQLQKKGLSANELKSYLTQIRSTKQVVLMDACHSGGALKSLNVRAAGADEKAIFQLARSSGVVTIASAGSKQFATEFEVLKHGVFTFVLLEALTGKADGNMDGKVTISEVKIYLEERVPELTKQYGGTAQYPTSYVTGNDFPLSILNK
jgi:WD40 repeat protein